jgi:hypothetical protein
LTGATPDQWLDVCISGVAVLGDYVTRNLRALAKVSLDTGQTRHILALATIDADVSYSAAAEIGGVQR